MTKGILIIALGHDNYKQMAFNLAISIRYNNPDLGICIASDKHNEHLRSIGANSFGVQYIDVPFEYFYNTVSNKIEYQKAKAYMDKLSPFGKTVYIDADSIFFSNHDTLAKKSFEPIFEGFQDDNLAFTLYNLKDFFKAKEDKSIYWFNGIGSKTIAKHYEIDLNATIYNIQSSFMYFKKSAKTTSFFKIVRTVYSERPENLQLLEWANGIGDEFAFVIAAAKTKHKQSKFIDIFYYPLSQTNHKNINHILKNYYYLSMAGHDLDYNFKELYNNLVKYYYNRYKWLKFPWFWAQKTHYLTEREKH